ncbi:hypothetical protein AGMMS49992_02960 [Clostridia bacterium]|nr:hypothetical protein AGMMS49992_02960 [Clostridia bacterium]
MDMLRKVQPIVSNKLFLNLSQIYENVKTIHYDRILFTYTKHGIDHSDRILENLLKLFPSLFDPNYNNRLNQMEVYCLVAAIYLHDIGIQFYEDEYLHDFCRKCESGSFKNKSKIDVSKASDKNYFVRKYHHTLTKFWILDSLAREPKLSASYVGDRELGLFVANICESHGIDFEFHQEYTKSEAFNGEDLRMGLLCTLLSLGDALDCDGRRIVYEKLKNQDVPLDSRIHWMKHYYVDSVNIRSGLVRLHYHFPECGSIEHAAVYQYYFQHQTKYWIEKCKEVRGKYLLEARISYDIDQSTRFDNYKDELTKEEFEYVKAEAISIIDGQIEVLNKIKEQLQQ